MCLSVQKGAAAVWRNTNWLFSCYTQQSEPEWNFDCTSKEVEKIHWSLTGGSSKKQFLSQQTSSLSAPRLTRWAMLRLSETWILLKLIRLQTCLSSCCWANLSVCQSKQHLVLLLKLSKPGRFSYLINTNKTKCRSQRCFFCPTDTENKFSSLYSVSSSFNFTGSGLASLFISHSVWITQTVGLSFFVSSFNKFAVFLAPYATISF